MPRQHFPTTRRRRRLGIGRATLLGATAAVSLSLALPATTPHGDVLDVVTDRVGPQSAVGLEPTPPSDARRTAAPVSVAASAVFADPRRPWLVGPVEPAIVPEPPGPPAARELTGYRWPIAHPRLTLRYGRTWFASFVVDGQPFHDGIDIATFCGDRIVATHDGTVLAAGRRFDRLMGWVGDLGPYFARLTRQHLWRELPLVVVIDDGNGYRSLYAHFGKLKVSKGDTVHAGQLLGFEGATGHATGCHLHYGLFSPAETATFRLRTDIAQRMKLPRHELARIDPMIPLPRKPTSRPADGGRPTDS